MADLAVSSALTLFMLNSSLFKPRKLYASMQFGILSQLQLQHTHV